MKCAPPPFCRMGLQKAGPKIPYHQNWKASYADEANLCVIVLFSMVSTASMVNCIYHSYFPKGDRCSLPIPAKIASLISEICPPGTYSNDGLATCLACPKGTYQPLANSTRCVSCPSGKGTAKEGSVVQSDCVTRKCDSTIVSILIHSLYERGFHFIANCYYLLSHDFHSNFPYYLAS